MLVNCNSITVACTVQALCIFPLIQSDSKGATNLSGNFLVILNFRKIYNPTYSLLPHTHHFNGHFPSKPGLAGCPLDSQSPVIIIPSVLTGQTENSSYLLFDVGR